MSNRHDDVFDAVLSGMPDKRKSAGKEKTSARFLKRGTAISDRLSGEAEDKVLRWVDPAVCKMWERHNRDYALLHPENCRDLIDGIRSQGRQEFPAIVRRVEGEEGVEYEVICGARRHFAVSWLRENNYPQFKYLIEVRDLSDEEAFRLADIENRDREDISDYERAVDYAQAIELYYGGKQKAMAGRLEVSEVWLSRYLGLAKLPQDVVDAFPTKRDIKELHARTLKPLMAKPAHRDKVLQAARMIAEAQQAARDGQGAFVQPAQVMTKLKAAVTARKTGPVVQDYRGLKVRKAGQTFKMEFPAKMTRGEFEAAVGAFIRDQY